MFFTYFLTGPKYSGSTGQYSIGSLYIYYIIIKIGPDYDSTASSERTTPSKIIITVTFLSTSLLRFTLRMYM